MSEEVQGLKKLLENIDEEKIGNSYFLYRSYAR